MSKHHDMVYFGDMLDAAREALSIAAGMAREGFLADRPRQLAITHLVQTIGEAAGRVSRSGQAQHPEISWNAITGMRNRIVHDYVHIKLDRVWDVVENDLAPLIAALEAFVPDSP